MLIPVLYLVDRLRQRPTRAHELYQTRKRLQAQSTAQVTEEERSLAGELHSLRKQLAQTIGQVTSCSKCARGYPAPHGAYDGGYCCGAKTEDLFAEEELLSLHLVGVRPEHLRAPTPARSPHAGCAFRGPCGCALSAAERPNVCVRYVCPDLARELHEKGVLAQVETVSEKMDIAYRAFVMARAERLETEALEGAPDAATPRAEPPLRQVPGSQKGGS